MALLNKEVESPICQQAIAQIEKSLGANQQDAFSRMVSAGMRIALNKGPRGLLGSLTQSKDPIADVVKGAIAISGIIYRESRGTAPLGVLVSAAMVLALHGLDFAARAKIIPEPTPEVVAQVTQSFIEELLPKFGITADRLGQMTQQTHGLLQDPAKVAALREQGVNVGGA